MIQSVYCSANNTKNKNALLTYIYFDTFDRSTPVTPRAPGSISPSGTANPTCRAILLTESSGTLVIKSPVAPKQAAAPAKNTDGGVFKAVAATGINDGENSMAVPTNGRIFSLDASKIPNTSCSSANFSSGLALVKVKPAFSSLVRRPNCDV